MSAARPQPTARTPVAGPRPDEPPVDPPQGVALALAAYVAWGAFPLYFSLVDGLGPVTVVAHRIVWGLLFCLAAMAVAGRWLGGPAQVRSMRARQIAGLALAAGVLSVNWSVFMYAVESGQVVQSSLGYFINPLVSVLLGVLVLRERLTRGQWVAVGVAGVAVAVLTVEAGSPPWIALTLACSFGLYGLLKKQVGRGVGALPGMTVETGLLVLPATALLVGTAATGEPVWSGSWVSVAATVGSGPATVIVLVVFAAAARRVRLSTIGLLQYIAPILQLLSGVLVLGEHMPPARWAGFALVWVALAVFSVDTLSRLRARPRGRT